MSAQYPVNTFEFEGETYTFYIGTPGDYIQDHHAAGKLFDYAELAEMARHIKDGDLLVDVGANVGNHAVFLSKAFPSSRIIVFEPNAEAAELLRLNLDANGCDNVDRSFIGVALSSQVGEVTLVRGTPDNLGGTHIAGPDDEDVLTSDDPGLHEVVPTTTLDIALNGLEPAFVKIDVEGHEFEVLAGMTDVLARTRPIIFIEVWNHHLDEFDGWLKANGYEVHWRDTHYRRLTNLLIKPVAGSRWRRAWRSATGRLRPSAASRRGRAST